MIEANEGYPPELILDDQHRSRSREDWEADRAEAEEVPPYFRRRSAGMWTCLAVLTVALGITVAYGYTVLEQEGVQLEQITGLTKSLPPITQHLANLERRLADSRVAQQGLASQVRNIDVESKSALAETRQQTGRLMAQMQQSLSRQINQQTVAFQAQVSRLANDRATELARVTKVEAQIAQERSDLEAARADYARELASVRDQQAAEHHELASLSSSLPTRQVAFDIQKNQPVEIAPGVFFRLTKADIGRQRFDGWIESRSGHQRVSVQGQGVRTPIVFYPSEDSKALEMVVTRICGIGAAGYVLTPAGLATADQAHIVSAAENPVSPGTAPSTGEISLSEP
jgi:hypothetical protein